MENTVASQRAKDRMWGRQQKGKHWNVTMKRMDKGEATNKGDFGDYIFKNNVFKNNEKG